MDRHPSVVHVVLSENFAGVERYVCHVANETARRGWRVSVVGGRPESMRSSLAESVSWLPGSNLQVGFASLWKVGQVDVCHVHMTAAELLATATRSIHRAPVVATRHFAA
ncbi:MAG TPA: glycosyltransferase, partial [Pseudonocardiaceae bacterium]|nr:glycosyltransferase [Pseudonocardiaceae bacterium]